jgi:hypothetical protein
MSMTPVAVGLSLRSRRQTKSENPPPKTMHIESEILSYRPEQLHQSTQALLAEITAGIEVPVGTGRKFRARKAKKQVDKPTH